VQKGASASSKKSTTSCSAANAGSLAQHSSEFFSNPLAYELRYVHTAEILSQAAGNDLGSHRLFPVPDGH
jgi:hypothetical protein